MKVCCWDIQQPSWPAIALCMRSMHSFGHTKSVQSKALGALCNGWGKHEIEREVLWHRGIVALGSLVAVVGKSVR